MDFHSNNPFSLFHEDILTNLRHCSPNGGNGGLSELLSQPTTGGDENAEWLSVFVEDCFSSPGNYILAPASQQVISKTSNAKPVGNLKPQPLINPSTVKNPSKNPSKKRKRETVSVMKLKTHKTQSHFLFDHNLDPEFEPHQDPLMLQQAHWLADSELIFPIKQNYSAKPESCIEEKEMLDVVSPSPELNMEPKLDKKKNMSKLRSCTHCQAKKTPLWREGPLGKGTLCNACGLRWLKSGKLFPEYRPANSPTFVSNRHSNVLRKVLKMREAHQSSVAEGADNGLSNLLLWQTTEGDKNSENSSVFMEDCFSCPGDCVVNPANQQRITINSNLRPLETLKFQLHNPPPDQNSEKPTRKRKNKTISLMNLKTHKNPSISGPGSYGLSLKPEPDPKSPLHQQAQRLACSELVFPYKQDSAANKEPRTKEKVKDFVVSPSIELYIEPKSDKKVSRPRQQAQRLADYELICPFKQNFAANEEPCTEEKVEDVAISPSPELYVKLDSDKKNVSKSRRCIHCQMTETPLWREGPSGKGTLCNACGLMWLKSRTLFPEYRPANSPTFMRNLHSNVLHTVLKMREAHQSSGA